MSKYLAHYYVVEVPVHAEENLEGGFVDGQI